MFIYKDRPDSISSEVYRSLRTNLKYVTMDNAAKIITITSSVPGEGKSTVTGNLALCLCESGNQVLIIDCDLRKPKIHKRFGCSNSIGLTDVLINNELLKEGLYKYSSKLTVLPAGSMVPNPAEILGSRTFEVFLKKIATGYDYVLIDTPPILAVTDGRLVSAKADGVLLVVRYGKAKEKQVIKAYEELKMVKANLLGSILNACDTKVNGAYYSYYGKKKCFFGKKRHRQGSSKIKLQELESIK